MDAGLGRSAAVDRALHALVAEKGAAAWADPAVAQAYLRSAIPQQGGRIELLVAAAELGVVSELANTAQRDTMQEARLAQRLVFERYFTDSDARFAVEAWARALHEPLVDEATTPSVPATATTPSAPATATTPSAQASAWPTPPGLTTAPIPARDTPPATTPAATRAEAPAAPPEPMSPASAYAPMASIADQPVSDSWSTTPAASAPAAPYPPQPPAAYPPRRPVLPPLTSRRKGTPLKIRPLFILIIVLFVMGNIVSQCNSSQSNSGSETSGSDTAVQYAAPTNAAEEYAVNSLGYQQAVTVKPAEAVSGLSDAPQPLRQFITAYAADSANATDNWLAIDNAENGSGYLILGPGDEYTTKLIVIRDSEGKFNLSGPLAAGIPSQ